MKHKCICGKIFEGGDTRKFCSRECYHKNKVHTGRFKKKIHEHLCMCGKVFYNKRQRVFCSRACWRKYHVPWNKGKDKYIDGRITNYAKHLVGHTFFGDKEKVRIANIGNKTWIGRKHRLDSKIKMSLAQTGDTEFNGFKKSGRQRNMGSIEYRRWRAAVLNRDKFTCQECNIRDIPLEAHHIKSYSKFPDSRYDISNGITLCVECHCAVDKTRAIIREKRNEVYYN